MLSSTIFRRAAASSTNNNINIRFVPPVAAQGALLGQEFAYSFRGKPSEMVWKPSSSSSSSSKNASKKDKNSNPIDLFCGVGKKPNTETLMKATFGAVRKARDMNRDKIGIELPLEYNEQGEATKSSIMKIKKLSDCTTTNMLKMFPEQEESSSNVVLSEDELLEKLSLYSHLAAYEYNDKKTGAHLAKSSSKNTTSKDDQDADDTIEARDKLLNYKPQLSFWKNTNNQQQTSLDKSPFVKTGKIIAENVNLARTWQNIRPDIGSPTYFAEHALKSLGISGGRSSSSGKSTTNSNVRLVDYVKGKQLQQKGLNLYYSVGKGASDANQPVMVVLEYNGNKKSDKCTALVGKGVVMDTGGLHVKPFGFMESMHQDMGGSAAVFGAFKAAVDLKLEQNIVCVLGFANNAVSGDSYHPSEIITSLKGTTVEVLNTDAEGRLILADCLTYVQKHANLTAAVDTVIDVATLTGAMVVALGEDRAGIFSNDAALCRNLVRASEETLEPLWPMPIGPEDHKKLQEGTLADMMNIGGGRYGGSCTAAAFLQHFIESHEDCLEYRGLLTTSSSKKTSTKSSSANKDDDSTSKNKNNKWAHLDIAGPGMGGSKATDRNPPGGTGYGVRLLTEYFRRM